jgi:hypothetical protein
VKREEVKELSNREKELEETTGKASQACFVPKELLVGRIPGLKVVKFVPMRL